MEVTAEHFKKAGSTPSDAPIETLMISTYCREKYLSNNKNKDPETFVLSTKEFNKNLFFRSKAETPILKVKAKRLQIIIVQFSSMDEKFTGDVLLKR